VPDVTFSEWLAGLSVDTLTGPEKVPVLDGTTSRYVTATLLAAFVVGGLTVAGFVIWLNIFPRTFIGRRIMLFTRQDTGGAASENQALVGQSGEAITPLRPSGTARIGRKRVDVTAVGDFLEQGVSVVVVAADGMRVAVRRQ
jgi:membrane-bound serine protease (ClpP class)